MKKHWVNTWLVTSSLDFIFFIVALFNNTSESLWWSASILAHRNFMKAGSFISTLSHASSNLVNVFYICLFFFLFLLKLVRATIKPIALRYSFYQTLGCFFSVWLLFVFFVVDSCPRLSAKHYKTSGNNFNLKYRRIFLMSFMSKSFQAVYYLQKALS